MKDNITAFLIVSIVRITGIIFAVIGIFAMQQGFIKTGVFLIVGAVLGSIFTSVKTNSKEEEIKTKTTTE